MKHTLLIIIWCATIVPGFAQEENKPVIKFSGLVKTDFFYDTRQIVGARDRHFLLWPEPVKLDPDGKDINAKGSFNMLSVQSRAGVSLSGIEYQGVKISALLEGDFFGQANENVNSIRLRHAYIKLNFRQSELLMGQYWNPLFTLDCYPGTVSFNTGVPFIPFSRSPQIRYTHNVGSLRFLAAAVGQQKEYTSVGGSEALRNSGIPDMHAQVHYQIKDEEKEFVAGIGGSWKTIVPKIVTDSSYKTDEKVSGLSGIAFLKFKNKGITAKLEGVLGENLYDVVQISSYAVKAVVDADKGIVSYTPIRNYSVWGEIHTNSTIQVGIFAGYSKNLGAEDEVISVPNSRCQNIDYLYRISPRIIIPFGKLNVGVEIEHTGAAFGEIGPKATVINTRRTANTRFLLSSYISF